MSGRKVVGADEETLREKNLREKKVIKDVLVEDIKLSIKIKN